MNQYRFYIQSLGKLDREIYPKYDSIDYDYEHQFDWSWDYMINFNTDLYFTDLKDGVNNEHKIELAYTFFYNLAIAGVAVVKLRIAKQVGNVYKNIFIGNIKVINNDTDSFNVSNRVFKASLESITVYSDIEKALDVEANIFDIDSSLKKSAVLNGLITYHNGYLLKDVITHLFTTNNIPLNQLPDFAPFLKNSTLNIDNLLIFQKSDVKRYDASNRATKGTISLQNIFEWLQKLFRLKIKTYSNDTYQFLHESEINTMKNSVDLTDQILKKNSFTFGFDMIPKIEKYVYAEKNSADFNDVIIDYKTSIGEDISNEVSDLCNDIQWIIDNQNFVDSSSDNTDQIGDSGFVLVACDSSFNVISTIGVYNYPLSWTMLFNTCHKQYLYLPFYYINGVESSNVTLSKNKKRVEDFNYFDNFNIENFVVLNEKKHYISKAAIQGNMITLDLKF